MQQIKDKLLPSAVIHVVVHLVPLMLISWLFGTLFSINDILMILLLGLLLTASTILVEILWGSRLVTSLFNIKWISPENDLVMHSMVKGIADKHQVAINKIGIIDLNTPNAFVYSSFRGNPCLLFTRGLIYNLNFSELQAITRYMLGITQSELLPIVTMLSGLQSIGTRLSKEYIENSVKKRKTSLLKTIQAGWGYLLFQAFNTQTINSSNAMLEEAETGTNELLKNPAALISGLLKISYLLDVQQDSSMRTDLISLKALMFQDPTMAIQDNIKLREILNHYNIKIEKILVNPPRTNNTTERKLHIFEKYFIHTGIEERIKNIIDTSTEKDIKLFFGLNSVN